MIRTAALLILFALAAVCAAQQELAPLAARQTTVSKYLGAPSCSATACHANVTLPSSQSIKDSEYIYWLENDPHALALQTLDNDRSTDMLLRLGIRNQQGAILKPARYQNCLACHNVSRQLDSSGPVHPDGVSCESCHGAARDWVDQHYTTTWRSMSRAAKSALGFKHTYDLSVRAAVCATCHVGGPNREVNHDMIAAGHPALKFEMSAYHDLLPKHWNHDGRGRWPDSRLSASVRITEKKWPERDADFELTLWREGRKAAARAALELLSHRASKAEQGGIWPELSEYDCFSCHHELTAPSWRQRQTRTGQLQWGSWNFANAASNRAAEDLRSLMRSSLNPDVERVLVAVDRALSSLPRFEPGPPSNPDWDSLVQSYLASVAQRVAQLDGRSVPAPQTDEDNVFQLQHAIRSKLAFPPNYESPKDLDQAQSRGGSDDPDTIRKEIEAVFSFLNYPAE